MKGKSMAKNKFLKMFGGKKEEVDGPKPPRELPVIQQEYQNLCVKAGHLQYQIVTLQKDLDALNSTLRDLNFEGAGAAAKAKKDEAEKAAKELADASSSEPKPEEKSNG